MDSPVDKTTAEEFWENPETTNFDDALMKTPEASPAQPQEFQSLANNTLPRPTGKATDGRHHCSSCGKSYKRSEGLQKHQQTACSSRSSTGGFSCKDCSQVFPTIERLTGHEVVHHKQSGYACSQCGCTFMQRHNQQRALVGSKLKTESVSPKGNGENSHKLVVILQIPKEEAMEEIFRYTIG